MQQARAFEKRAQGQGGANFGRQKAARRVCAAGDSPFRCCPVVRTPASSIVHLIGIAFVFRAARAHEGPFKAARRRATAAAALDSRLSLARARAAAATQMVRAIGWIDGHRVGGGEREKNGWRQK